MIEAIVATYNEETEIEDLIQHLYNYVDRINIVDDGSTDLTVPRIHRWVGKIVQEPKIIEHTGLPEKVKAEALKRCDPDSWVLMLDADERYGMGVRGSIAAWLENPPEDVTHVWFTLNEYMDNRLTRTFQKCRLFKASAAHFSDNIHTDDWFDGKGAFYGWEVVHRKTSIKQMRREQEYLNTYKRLVEEGVISEDRARELKSMHYFIR